MDFSVAGDVEGDLAVVTAQGEIDVATSEPLRQALLAVEQEGARHVVVDLARVDFLRLDPGWAFSSVPSGASARTGGDLYLA